jgi:hypothetical protein
MGLASLPGDPHICSVKDAKAARCLSDWRLTDWRQSDEIDTELSWSDS